MSQTSPTRSQGPIIPTQQALEFILPQSSQNSQQSKSNNSEQNLLKRPKEEEKEENNENKNESNRGKKKRQKKNSGSSYEEEVERLKDELRMIDEGTHPELIEQFELFEKRRKRQVELEDIEDEFEEAEIKRISSEMQKKEKEASAEAEERVAGIVQQLLNELDREMKKVDSYISGLDIARFYNEMPCDSSKKILRAPISYLPIKKPTDTGKTIQPPIPLSSKINTFLLKDAEIADDLKSIGTDGKSSPMKGSSHIDVTLSKLKFSYGGRWYKPSEEVLVENREYGKIPAKIDTINDEVVIFKSCFSWDVRQICASSADFAEGRVIIHNKKRNA